MTNIEITLTTEEINEFNTMAGVTVFEIDEQHSYFSVVNVTVLTALVKRLYEEGKK